MSKILALWGKEFKAYWYSPIAYIVIMVCLGLITWLFVQQTFETSNVDMRMVFGWLGVVFAFVMPALSMRMWSDEIKSGSLELLMTMPLKEWEAVLGKYLASVSLLLIILVMTLPLAFTANGLSEIGLDWGVTWAMYLGAFLLGAAYLAIGTCVSSFSRNQIVAFLIALTVIGIGYLLGILSFLVWMPTWLASTLRYLSMPEHYQAIGRGIIDTRDLLFYVTSIFLFLYLTVRSVEQRKWS